MLSRLIKYIKANKSSAVFALMAASFALMLSVLSPTRKFAVLRYLFEVISGCSVSFIGAFVLDSKLKPIKKLIKEKNLCSIIISAIYTSVSIYYFIFYGEKLLLNILGSILGSIFLFIVIYNLFEYTKGFLKRIYKSIGIADKIIFVAFAILIFVSALLVLNSSNLLLSIGQDYDVFFSADIRGLLNNNAFINPFHPENDFRQMLFAFLSLPFSVPAIILSLIPFAHSYEIWIIVIQGVLVLIIAYMLAHLMKLSSMEKYAFIAFFLSASAYMVYVFVVEQYIISLFWTLIAVYAILENRKHAKTTTVLSTGALFTNAALIPLACATPLSLWRENKKLFIKKALKELLLILFFALFLFSLFGQLRSILGIEIFRSIFKFGGAEVSFYDKLIQNTYLIQYYFIIPKWTGDASGIRQVINTSPSIIGIAILLIACAAFVICRKNKFAQVCFYWILTSFFTLLIVGWGTWEHGLYLYASYYGWAYIALLVCGLRKVAEKLKLPKQNYIVTGIMAVAAIVLITINVLKFIEIIQFGIEHIPTV